MLSAFLVKSPDDTVGSPFLCVQLCILRSLSVLTVYVALRLLISERHCFHHTYPRPAQRMSPTPAPTRSILMNIPIRLFPRESFLRIVLQYIHWNGMAGS